jgi:glycosyltransferase involved in cell wall biosynthesis
VLRQTYPHIEYLVVDGGSTDDSLAILRSYGERFWWVAEPDDGQAHALNKGFARARGEIWAYLNADDILLPRAVETAVAYFQRNSDWQLLYGRASCMDENDRPLGAYRTLPFSLRRLAEDSCICQPATFWRRKLAEQLGPFHCSLHYCMDYDYWLRAALAGCRIAAVDDLLACVRLHPQAKTFAGKTAMYLESMAVCRRALGWVSRAPFLGLWRYLCHEHPTGWRRWLGQLPGAAGVLATLHWGWWNYCSRTETQPCLTWSAADASCPPPGGLSST